MYTLEQFKKDYPAMKERALKTKICLEWTVLLDNSLKAEDLLQTKPLPTVLYYYARWVVKKRIPEFEKIIGGDPDLLYRYARYIVKGRVPEFEEIVKSDPKQAYFYACDIAECRIPEFEEAISKSPMYAYLYSKYVAKCRIPEFEEVLKADEG